MHDHNYCNVYSLYTIDKAAARGYNVGYNLLNMQHEMQRRLIGRFFVCRANLFLVPFKVYFSECAVNCLLTHIGMPSKGPSSKDPKHTEKKIHVGITLHPFRFTISRC